MNPMLRPGILVLLALPAGQAHREGPLTALLSWFEKTRNSPGSFLPGVILLGIGFHAKRGPQSEQAPAREARRHRRSLRRAG